MTMQPKAQDQAETLRSLHQRVGKVECPQEHPGGQVRVFSVASGKGGVGKTTIVTHLAVAMAQQGRKVLLIDADLGLANIDVVFDLSIPYNLNHFFSGERTLKEIMVDGPHGVKILPAGSGMQKLAHLDSQQKMHFLAELDALHDDVEIVLIDTEAGISENVTYFTVASQEIIVLTTPEPTAITDAYALMKVLSLDYHQKHFHLLVNLVTDGDEGLDVYRKLSVVSNRYLDISIDYLGCLPADKQMREAALKQKTMIECCPDSEVSMAFEALAKSMLTMPVPMHPKGTPQFFWQRLMAAEAKG